MKSSIYISIKFWVHVFIFLLVMVKCKLLLEEHEFYAWPPSLLSFFSRVLKILPLKGNVLFLYNHLCSYIGSNGLLVFRRSKVMNYTVNTIPSRCYGIFSFPYDDNKFWALELMFSTPKQDWNSAHEVHCSRERSRAAWKIIEEVFIQHLNGVSL